jgi:hypothetical protein
VTATRERKPARELFSEVHRKEDEMRRASLFSKINRVLLPSLALVCSTLAAQTCAVKDYKIFTPNSIALRCAADVSNLSVTVKDLYRIEDYNIIPLQTIVSISHFKTSNEWLLLTLSGPDAILKPNQKYRLTLSSANSEIKPDSPDKAIDIDTSEAVTLIPSTIKSQPQQYRATSHVAFSLTGKRLTSAGLSPKTPCRINLQDDTGKRLFVEANCSTLDSLPTLSPSSAQLADIDPDRIGLYVIDLNKTPHADLVPSTLAPLETIFGNTPKLTPKSRFTAQKAPSTKDASQYYVNFNYAAAVGAAPAWALDAKLAPQISTQAILRQGLNLAPLALANVGSGSVKGQAYTNTIDFGFTAQKLLQPNRILQELLISPAIVYETDKQFDRNNLLAVIDFRYNFKHLYRTQSIATLQHYYTKLLAARAAHTSEPTLGEIKPATIGYALDFHTILEAGGALRDTTVSATTGPAKLALPVYSIARIAPQIHGLLQISRASIDATITGRYLATIENTAVQTPTNALYLEHIQGWKGVGTITALYNLDTLGHFCLNFEYRDGFTPPVYQRVNGVQAGLLFKY